MTVFWRTGQSVGRTIYIQQGDEASKGDKLIGVMDSRGLADLVVIAVNHYLTEHTEIGLEPEPDAGLGRFDGPPNSPRPDC